MGNNKRISLDHNKTGKTLYCIINSKSTGQLLSDADGVFAANPADPYVSLTEHAVIKGRYELLESRSAWPDGIYTVAIYEQSGGNPAPSADTIVGSGEMVIVNDLEVDIQALYDRLVELREGNIKRVFTVAEVQIPARNVDVGRLDSMTLIVKADAAADWDNPVSTKTLYFRYAAMGDVNPVSTGD